MNTKNLLIAVAVLLLVFVLFVLFRTESPVDEEEERMPHVDVVLSEVDGSGQSGTALLEDLGGNMTYVTVNVTEGFEGPQPAHIHFGTCEDLGGVAYPFEDVVNGFSGSTINVSLAELLEGTFAINVHLSAEQMAVNMACGNI